MTPGAPDPSPGASWLDRFFSHYFESNPVNATFIGRHAWDGRLPDFSRQGVERRRSRIDGLLAEATALDLAGASFEETTDVRLARGALRIEKWEIDGTHFHRGNPSLYTGEVAFGLISLFLTDYAPLPERVDAAVERLRAIPGFLQQARRNIERAPRPWTERAIKECEGALALVSDGLAEAAGEAGQGSKGFFDALTGAAEALTAYRAFLAVELAGRAREGVAAGGEALELLLREGHFLREDATEIERYAVEELERTNEDVARRASRDFGGATPADVLARLRESRPSLESYEAQYQRTWEAAREKAESMRLLTWPDFPLRFVPRPSWVRAAAPSLYFLFYRSPAAEHRPAVHDYLISPLDSGMDDREARAFLEAHNHSVIKLNHVIHHGGIGHHVQNFHAFRSLSRIGRIAAVDGASRISLLCGGTMAEGWACYATDLMGEAGFLTPLELFAERQGRARMCARAIADVRIHQGRWTLHDAATFYETKALMPAASAWAEAVKNSMFPGAALMYLSGRDAIHRLRARVSAAEGHSFSLLRFHDRLLSFGSIPVRLIADAMVEKTSAGQA